MEIICAEDIVYSDIVHEGQLTDNIVGDCVALGRLSKKTDFVYVLDVSRLDTDIKGNINFKETRNPDGLFGSTIDKKALYNTLQIISYIPLTKVSCRIVFKNFSALCDLIKFRDNVYYTSLMKNTRKRRRKKEK